MKKILIAIIIVLIIIVGGLWWYIRSNTISPINAPGASSSPIVPFPIATDRPISVISGTGSTGSSSFAGGQGATEQSATQAYELYSRPVVGYRYISIATSTALVFMDRDSGHLYLVRGEGGSTRVSNTTLLGVERAWWVESKDKLFTIVNSRESGFPRITLYSVKKTELLSAFTASSSPAALVKEGDIDTTPIDIAPAPIGSKFLLLSKEGSERSKIEVVDAPTLKRTLLASNIPFTELSLEWRGAQTATLSTKPSFSAPGVLFTLNTSTGVLERVVGASSNFFALSDKLVEHILYTDGSRSKIWSRGATSTQILNLAALPEKCAWSSLLKGVLYCATPRNQGEFLLQRDVWLRGETSTRDDLWWIDTRNGTADVLAELSYTFDASTLVVSPNENTLILKNRLTGGIVRIPIPQESYD